MTSLIKSKSLPQKNKAERKRVVTKKKKGGWKIKTTIKTWNDMGKRCTPSMECS